METFIQWITEIVLFLLLAMMADALLPSGLMKKYARLVLSILLLLVIIDPLLGFLKLDPNQLLYTVENQMQEGLEAEHLNEEIEEKKNEILNGQDAYTLQQVKDAIVKQLKEPIEMNEQVTIEEADLTFFKTPHSLESLDKLVLFVSSTESGDSVEEVVISAADQEEIAGSPQFNEDSIRESAAQLLNLSEEQIEIRWEESHE
ncbi:stage III sporulation protein AF [Halobacillus sp. A5]|uniref:stage III sporulation protein AF n=1 Tax=Halobacillus sp. A5 TaxID=2880263 RepID=UPI0020A6460E|nr:stage III sporulation protein AF [Halobacillus sp. A5]MCP3025722.1 stage III sporulation protein AF [Halobacillus sp. A5]